MGSIKRSPVWDDPRTKPPYGTVEVDWGHPLAAGLVHCSLFNEGAGGPRDLAYGIPGTRIGSNPPVWTPGARGLTLDGQTTTTGNGVDFGATATSADLHLGKSSFVCLFQPTQTTANACVSRITGGGVGWFIGDLSDNGWWGMREHVGLRFAFATIPPIGQWTLGVLTQDGADTLAADVVISYNGVVQSHVFDLNGTGTLGLSDLAGPLQLMTQSIASSESSPNNLALVYLYKGRQLPINQHLWLTNEPYAFLRPIIRRRYFVRAAAAATGVARTPQFLTLGVGS